MLSDERFQEEFRKLNGKVDIVKREVHEMKANVEDLEEVIRGNEKQGILGVLPRMIKYDEIVDEYGRLKWAGKVLIAVLGSQFFLSVATLVVTLVM